MLRESRARVLFVPSVFRGRDHAAMADAVRSDLAALEHVVVLDGPVPAGDAAPLDAPLPGPDQIAQLLFTSGTSGEPKGALHRHDTLMRAADHQIDHFGLSGGDVVYIPSPLAHQTGFLYGMWIAIRLGVPQVLQEVWDAEVGLDAMRRFGVTFVQAATPFLADLTRVAERARRAPGPAAHVRRHRRRDPPRARAAVPRGARRRGRRSVGHDRELPGLRVRPRRSARARLGHRRASARRNAPADRRRRGPAAGRRRRGQLRGPQRLPVRGLPEPPGADRRGGHPRRLVSHRRPGPDRRRRLRADHRPRQGRDQPRRREGAGRRDRATAPRPPGGARCRDRGDARRAPRRARLRVRGARRRRGPRLRGDARVPRRLPGLEDLLARAAGAGRDAPPDAVGQDPEVRPAQRRRASW